MKNAERMHIDDIKALAKKAHENAAFRNRLLSVMLDAGDDAVTSAWALTHLPPSDTPQLATRRHELISLAVTTPSTSLRRLALTLLERMAWEEEDVDTALLDFSLRHLAMDDETAGVRSLCGKLAFHQCRHYPELLEELRQSLLMLRPTPMSQGVRHTINSILNKIPHSTK